MSSSGRNTIFYLYASGQGLVQGIVVGRHIDRLSTFKQRIEAGLRNAGERAAKAHLTPIQMLEEKSSTDRKIMDACLLIRNKDMLYLPVNVFPKGCLSKVLPPGYFRLDMVQLISQFYNECRVSETIEEALIRDLQASREEQKEDEPLSAQA
jgi:hypothetical protein